MPHPIIYILLVLSGAMILGAIVITSMIVAGIRKGYGAKRMFPRGGLLLIGTLLALHVGFFASPILFATGYGLIAIRLMLPISAIVTVGIVAIIAKLPQGPSLLVDRPRFTFFLSLLAVAYWSPVGALMFAA